MRQAGQEREQAIITRPGYHTVGLQVPDVLWDSLETDATARNESVTQALARVLCQPYHVPVASIPPRRKPGPKRKWKQKRKSRGLT